MFEWDETKRQANLAKHGVDFAALEEFDWATSVRKDDTRYHYGESRRYAYGLIGTRVHVVIYTERLGRIRVISLRKANFREVDEWVRSRT